MEHFRILPTDPRYKTLAEDQIEVLFINFLFSLSEDEYRTLYRKKLEKEDQVESLPEEVMKKMGYTKEEIENTKGALRAR